MERHSSLDLDLADRVLSPQSVCRDVTSMFQTPGDDSNAQACPYEMACPYETAYPHETCLSQ
ncbi:hypothetical protein SAMN06265222_12243 [Neorhodopirellula lusitana]|uniref:Uncharacterized protein n=1 Tax=Neorhodopirellula lusitana TaxID=445327 RepID=A0ABY1QRQ4_9BACT|nr:hypothetical protein SAMN06265222_12243 [Neorhodopirellula lusitana]